MIVCQPLNTVCTVCHLDPQICKEQVRNSFSVKQEKKWPKETSGGVTVRSLQSHTGNSAVKLQFSALCNYVPPWHRTTPLICTGMSKD